MCLRTLKNSGRAVQTDPTLLRFGDHGTKKCWELLAQKFDRLQTFATTCKGVQTDTTCNIRQCWQLLANNVASVCTGLYTPQVLCVCFNNF